MELYQLRTFAAVAELGHLTRAAERLHVSQPAVSAQIKALEDELGAPLFDRGSAGMTLTAAGSKLLPFASRVLGAASDLRNQALSLKGEIAGHLKVGTLADPRTLRLGDLLARAIERHPLLHLELRHEVTGAAFAKVRDGELDASFYYGQRVDAAIAAVPLREFAYRVVGPTAWRDQLSDASWDDIAALPWIMTPAISTHHALAGKLFEANGVAPSTRIEADHEAVIRSLVVTGVGLALMREDVALEAANAGEVVVWGDVRLATTLEFLYLKRRENEPALRALIDVLRQVWAPAPADATV